MDDVVWDDKRALRARLRSARRTRAEHPSARVTAALTANLVELARRTGARSLSCYLSSAIEPSTRPFLNWAFEQGIEVLFPIAREDGLLDWVIGDGESETEGLFGLPEVVGEIQPPMAIAQVDLILVPALAIDRAGNRLGQGRGYYDKVLGSMTECPPVYGVVFEEEFLDSVPVAPVDRAVDGVVTPDGIVAFGPR